MFLISDKLDKSDSKYDLTKEDKAELLKEEKSDVMKEEGDVQLSKMNKFHKWNIVIIVLLGMLFCVSIWMMVKYIFIF